jgi:hypothetical protein|tara:strand:+ start:1590 stop:1799 length:210 start_codon:yes stop_codon:yes gene_type:complete
MKQLLMTKEIAMDYLSMDEEAFDKFIKPYITTLRFDDLILYIGDQLDEVVYDLIDESPVTKGFELHLVE